MRFVRILAVIPVFLLAIRAQEFPPAIDISLKISAVPTGASINNLAIDIKGNIYLAGSTRESLNTTHTFGTLGNDDIFIMKLDSSGQQVLYSVRIGGSRNDDAVGLKVDPAGNAYLLGFTQSEDYPYTLFQGAGVVNGTVLLRLNPAGDALLYNTVLSWPSSVSGWVLDNSGAIYFGGIVESGKLPVTPGAYQPLPGTIPVFVAKLNSHGAVIDAATYVGSTIPGLTLLSQRPNGDLLFSAGRMIGALDASLGHLVVSNTPAGSDPTLTYIGSDAATNLYFFGVTIVLQTSEAHWTLRKYSPDGQQLLKSSPLEISSSFRGIVTGSGTVLLFDSLALPNFPIHKGSQPCAANSSPLVPPRSPFVEAIGPEGEVAYATFMNEDILATISASDGRPYAIASDTLTDWRGIVRFNPDYRPPDNITAGCLVHSATFEVTEVSPGTFMTIFGDGIGPDKGVSWESGSLFDLAGTRVTVDGKSAPVVYAQSRQINFITPWSLRTDGAVVPICVTARGQTSCLKTKTTPAAVGFFIGNQTIAAINPDGTINSQEHPAPAGSFVSLYLTGSGPLDTAVVDGGFAGLMWHRLAANVSATLSSVPVGGLCPRSFGCTPQFLNAPVLFAGAVPTLIYGVEVVIIRVPSNVFTGYRGVTVQFELPGYFTNAYGNLWFGP